MAAPRPRTVADTGVRLLIDEVGKGAALAAVVRNILWMHDHDGMRIGASSAGSETYLVKSLRARLADLEACDPDLAPPAIIQPARSAA
ncbi:hypothetical protein [Methylobacterium soli]|uniref:Uncharacterized protein n=1 Tax=Methylobacterium soli TaxID=553447 RepID=A0A6L3STP0_9HYPH|nr:hypothetical protein [Methylobacterium soli]KAB1075425.1 hypothetical protein F6X53_25000 [Methylobacterium soli]GJE41323.1 hypothetical protein AEGHOMDF_0487 [Methylobacterium soli]